MQIQRYGAGVFTIENFLTPQECQQFIAESEARGYQQATIQTEDGARLYEEARNNERILFDDRALADQLYLRAQSLLPAEFDGWRLSGFNQRFRYYRYEKQQHFVWHQDGTVRLSEHEESILTFLMYLNDDFVGGNTEFGWDTVKPVQGMALVFPHRLRHQGAVVTGGVKYVLRTDVMYRDGLA